MTKSPSFFKWFLPAAAVFAAGFAVATFYDLPLSMALYSPGNLFAILMEGFGWYPAFAAPLVLAALWALGLPGLPASRRVLGAAVGVFGLAAMYTSSYGTLMQRGLLRAGWDARVLLWLAAGLAVPAVLLFLLSRTGQAVRHKLVYVALVASVFTALNQLVVYSLKFLWQRPRFDTMVLEGTFASFRPWYLPFGPGGSSFPSGHTANAAMVFSLLLLCDVFRAWNKHRRLVWAGCWCYTVAMGFARVLIGRHFLSDTLAAAALMALLFCVIHHSGLYVRALGNVRQGLGPARKRREEEGEKRGV